MENFRYVKLPHCKGDPKKAFLTDAGFDICSASRVIIPVGESLLIPTGLVVAIPNGYYGRIASRSGLAVRSNIEVGAGTIDSSFRGELKVLLRNLGNKDFYIEETDRIAQLIIQPIYTGPAICVESLEETDRGVGGFGSTGTS